MRTYVSLLLLAMLALTIAACDSGVTPDAAAPELAAGDAFGKDHKELVCHVGNELPEYVPGCVPDDETVCGDAGKIDLIEVPNLSKHIGNPDHCWPIDSDHCDYEPGDVPGASGEGTEDEDGDGIDDGCDVCPNDELNDADGDGVCGDVDACEGTPPGTEVGPDGCAIIEEPCADPESGECDDYCRENPADEVCAGLCEAQPESVGCDQYCIFNPLDDACAGICEAQPGSPGCESYCTRNPADAVCAGFCQDNPRSPACDEYCISNPSDDVCANLCEAQPESLGCELYVQCTANPDAPECNCGSNPDAPECD